MCNGQCAICSMQFTVCGKQCAVCILHCAMCNVYCAVCNVQCAMCSVRRVTKRLICLPALFAITFLLYITQTFNQFCQILSRESPLFLFYTKTIV